MFELRDIVKTINAQPVVNQVSLVVNRGEIFGLLAPGTTGKTTVIRVALTIIKPDRGEVVYDDQVIKRLSGKQFGYLPQRRGIYPRARVINYLIYAGILNQLSRNQARLEAIRYLDKFDIIKWAETRLGECGTVVQEKIQIMAAILHEPDILVIDEPFNGFSKENGDLIRNILIDFKRNNRIVMLASRDLGAAEHVCDRVCFMDNGKVILNTTIAEIRNRMNENIFYLESEDDISFLKQQREIQIREERKNLYKITIKDKQFDGNKLAAQIIKNIKIIKFEQFRPGLSELYSGLVKTLQKRKG